MYNHLNDNQGETTKIHNFLVCPGDYDYAKKFGAIVGALCSEYWPVIVHGSTKFIRTGKIGGEYPFFDPVAYKIDGEINVGAGLYDFEQEVSGPILPDFLQIYTIALNLRLGNTAFQASPLEPIRLYQNDKDESIYLPAAAIYNVALDDSYESIKTDVLNILQLFGLGAAARILSVPTSSRLLKLIAATEIVKAGVLDDLFLNNAYIRSEILKLEHGQDFLDVYAIISPVVDIATLSAEWIFTRLDKTGPKVVEILENSPTVPKAVDEGAPALRHIVEVASLINALKKVYPVLNNYNNFDDLAALPNVGKLLGSDISAALKTLDEPKQLALFDDLLLNNGSLIDDFADSPLLAKAWGKIHPHANRTVVSILTRRVEFDAYPSYPPTTGDWKKINPNNANNGEEWFDPNTGGYVVLHKGHESHEGVLYEYDLADALAKDGRAVKLRNEKVGDPAFGGSRPDAEIDGVIFDFKNFDSPNNVDGKVYIHIKESVPRNNAHGVVFNLQGNSATLANVNKGLDDLRSYIDNEGIPPGMADKVGLVYSDGSVGFLTKNEIINGAYF